MRLSRIPLFWGTIGAAAFASALLSNIASSKIESMGIFNKTINNRWEYAELSFYKNDDNYYINFENESGITVKGTKYDEVGKKLALP